MALQGIEPLATRSSLLFPKINCAVPCVRLPKLAVLGLHPALKGVETPAPEGLPGLLTPFTPPGH